MRGAHVRTHCRGNSRRQIRAQVYLHTTIAKRQLWHSSHVWLGLRCKQTIVGPTTTNIGAIARPSRVGSGREGSLNQGGETAQALGLNLSREFLLLTDEVIE
jgi:hypothetical protein